MHAVRSASIETVLDNGLRELSSYTVIIVKYLSIGTARGHLTQSAAELGLAHVLCFAYMLHTHGLMRPVQLANGLIQGHSSRDRHIQGAYMRLCNRYPDYLPAALVYGCISLQKSMQSQKSGHCTAGIVHT